MQKINLDLGENSYNIFIGKNYFNKIAGMIVDEFKYQKIVIVTDDNVEKLYLSDLLQGFNNLNISTFSYTVEAGEKSKSIRVLENLYQYFTECHLTRKDLIIALGGGVIGDLAGFAAATFLRGVDFIQIPTSLLSQVDSSVGGKVAVNLPQGKNLVGNFYQPKAVYIDVHVLSTLDRREFISGMAEVVKYAFIEDKTLFDDLMTYDLTSIEDHIIPIIRRCVEIKAQVVERDEKESGERMLLNFGHTIGHAIEKLTSYSKFNHGEAVGMGMVYFFRAMRARGMMTQETYDLSMALLEKYELDTYESYDIDELVEASKLDKKSDKDKLNIILLESIGKAYIKSVDFDWFREFILEGTC
ncbi:3-dehydroquinate synthase [Acidaminobacter sp. JC074]|uniref:3-dehydroquinate synthase n=1 Tax=Acidaminobacter sp. JC074 TaxID=2530199 RepID=UPI001F0F630A|nr:3-dehydroquinate synthase [Acidaminobacter sp. JC074]MCH4889983.1 3-dehydroquinate synthase [Acidaminobacter sp. JC074]